MFRFSKRFRLDKLFKNGAIRKSGLTALTLHDGTSGHGVASRYLSHEPLSYSEDSYTKCIPPLFHPLPGLKLPICLPDSAEQNPTKVTTLPNGLRVASEDALGPAACVGIYIDSGSIYETEESIGVTHLLERLAFKSTKHRSHLQIVHEVESTGGNVGASASREQMGYSYDTLKAYLPAAVELLIDCVRNPVFLESEVQEQVNRIKWEIGDITKDPQQFLLDSLHLAGFSGALGKPLMAPESALERINGSKIGKFYQENYTADRMVLEPAPPPSPSRQCNGFGSPFSGEEGGSGGPRDHFGSDSTPSPPSPCRRAMETKPPPPPLPPPQLQRRGKWVVPLLASFFLSSLFISASIFSSSSSFSSSAAASLSRQALLLLSFSQIPTPIGDDPLFVESKLRSRPLSDAAPARPVPRLAYLISGSAGDGASLRRTLRALYHPVNQYVLHLDLEASAAERLELTAIVREDPVYTRFRNVRVVSRANLVTYRGPTMVSNTLHAAAILLKEAGDWDWFINLSASDYPLVTQDDLLYTLSSLPRDLNFIEHTSDIGWKEYHRAKPVIIDPGLYSSQKTDVFWISEKRSVPTAFKLFTGSAWMMLSHQFIEFLLWGWDNLPRTVLMYYANFLSSPEGYFHTVICNAREFRNTTVNHDLHFISWDNPPKQHPHLLTLNDFSRMVSSNAPFARKFGRDDPVLDKIDKELLGRDHDGFVPSAWYDNLKMDTGNNLPFAVRNATELRPGAGSQRVKALITGLLSADGFDKKHCI